LKRRFKVAISIASLIVLILLISLPFIAKYLLINYAQAYSGRKVSVKWIYINPITGYLQFNKLKIYEANGDSVFFSSEGLSLHISITRLFSKTLEINNLILDQPKGKVIQHQKRLNFDDLITLFTNTKSSSGQNPFHFEISNIRINNGEFSFLENEIPIKYAINKMNLESKGIKWNTDTIGCNVSFHAGKTNSNVQGNFTINYKTFDYRFAVVARTFDLDVINQYLKALVNYGTFRATMDVNLRAHGNFKDEENINAKGSIILNDLHLGKDSTEDYASFKKLEMDLNQLNPQKKQYNINALWLDQPYFKYERYDSLDNLETMFGEKGSNISKAKANSQNFNLIIELFQYTKVLVRNFFTSSYRINKLTVSNGNFRFNDYSLNETFSINASPVFISGDSLDKNKSKIYLYFKSGMLPYGSASANLCLNPNDSSDFDLNYHLQQIPASLFNPYLITYTSYALDRGTIELAGDWMVRNGIIQSNNHLLIIDPRINGRLSDKSLYWMPMPLIMAFLRQRDNVIDYQIPVSGNLKNPKFNLKNVWKHIIENILIKPITIPYSVHVKNTEEVIENSLNIKWRPRNCTLTNNQIKFIVQLTNFLKENYQEHLCISPISYADMEKEQILFFQAKKKYFLLKKNILTLSEKDSILLDKMSIKDPVFLHFLDKQFNPKVMFTVKQRCSAFVGVNVVTAAYNLLLKQREAAITAYFIKNHTSRQLIIRTNENAIPYNGFSYFQIKYNGTLPESLLNAYKSMNRLNQNEPRIKYLKYRNKNKITV